MFPLRVAIHAVTLRTKGDSVLTHKLWLDDPGSTFIVFVTGKRVVTGLDELMLKLEVHNIIQ